MTAALLSIAASLERDMKNNVVPIERPAPDATISACREMIKSMVLSMEDEYGTKSTARNLDSIVRNFAVYGCDRPSTHFRTPEGGFIWVFLQIMTKASSHKTALDTIREIQSEYCGFVNAMSA